MTEIIVYENHDISLAHPTHAFIPLTINTLELFLNFVSARIAATSGDISASGRYKFVYSLTGKPLWRVEECRAIGKLVVSCTPGFLKRRNIINEEHNNKEKEKDGNNAVYPSRGNYNVREGENRSEASIWNTGMNSYNNNNNNNNNNNIPRGSFPEGVSSTLGKSSNIRISPEKENISKKLFGPDSDTNNFIDKKLENLHKSSSFSFSTSTYSFNINGRYIILPTTPRFTNENFLTETEVSHTEKCASIQTLISIKLIGHSFRENDLLFKKELYDRFNPIIMKSETNKINFPIRIVIEGPPKSGVSTALAYCSYLLASTEKSHFYTALFLPLNFNLLFNMDWLQSIKKEEKYSNINKYFHNFKNQQELLLDIPFFYLTIIRFVIDCAVAQKPSLRYYSNILIEAWEQLVTYKGNENIRFSGSQLAKLVGHQTLQYWENFALNAIQIIRAAEASPNDIILRDAFIETVLIGVISQIATALHFSSVVYIIDELKCLLNVLQHRVHRPTGDVGIFLKSLSRRTWTHVIIGIDTLAFPPCSVLFTSHIIRVGILHLISYEILTKHYKYPSYIYCNGKRFSIQLFMGAPGYVRAIHTLLISLGYTSSSEKEKIGETLYLEDNKEVFNALQELMTVLQVEVN